MSRTVRMLTLSSLYPSEARPRHGVFVENRLAKLVEAGGIRVRVIAPVPWFPFTARVFGDYSRYAATARAECRRGINVVYPRYPMVPRVSTTLQPALVASAVARSASRARAEGFDFDLIDAHYFYPDGVAAVDVAARYRKPLVITARGSDINVIAQLPGPRRRILQAARFASAIISVSAALKTKMVDLGMDAERINVLRNGVDMHAYAPIEQTQARAALGLASGPVVASVGNLVPGKGHDLAMRSIARLNGVVLLIVGGGPQRASLGRLARELGIDSRVHFTGELPPERMPTLYSAADLLVLASNNEGWPNVVLEALACGVAVVAADVGGVREILTADVAGTIVEERTTEAFALALNDRLVRLGEPAAVRTFASQFSWDEVVGLQTELYQRVADECAPASREMAAIAIEKSG
jgi:teichuronic acid biosynthesis glycosyltransferase TuaC